VSVLLLFPPCLRLAALSLLVLLLHLGQDVPDLALSHLRVRRAKGGAGEDPGAGETPGVRETALHVVKDATASSRAG